MRIPSRGFIRRGGARRAVRAPAPVLLLALLLAGCGAPEPAPEPPGEPSLMMYALDGRWPFDPARAEARLAAAGAPPSVGALVLGEAAGARAVGEFAGLDARAASRLGVRAPAPGEAIVARAWAEREGAPEGGTLTLRGRSTPDPYVATYFEMERTQPCERREEAKLCFLPSADGTVARLRLRVDPGARDGAFLPDLVELGAGARPAWWNGSFEGPGGETRAFSAYAGAEGTLVPGEVLGEMTSGEWVISFRLEMRLGVAPAGAAGIVRVREPGYHWFDDRLQQHADPAAQARAVLANGSATSLAVRIVGVADDLPAGADIILALDDARALSGAAERVSALLVDLTPAQEAALEAARGGDGVALALRARPLPAQAPMRAASGALVLAAPGPVDLAALPAVPGAGAPALALAGRPPVGEAGTMDDAALNDTLLLLAHADGPVPWSLPPGSRWTRAQDALDNLSRSRTLALASPDLGLGPVSTAPIEIGSGNTTRSMVAIGGVEGGPEDALWTSAALVAGAGRPALPRLIVPVDAGADRDAVARAVLEAWAEHGVALDR